MKKKSIAILSGISVAAVIGLSGVTYSAWSDGFTFGDSPFTIIKSNVSLKVGETGTIGSTNIGSEVVSMLDENARDTLASAGEVAAPVIVTGTATESVGISYNLSSSAVSGLYEFSDTILNAYAVANVGSCTVATTGTALYSGPAEDFTLSNRTLINSGTSVETTASEVICLVMSAATQDAIYNQTATVTGDTIDGQVTDSSEWSATVRGNTINEGDITIALNWSLLR